MKLCLIWFPYQMHDAMHAVFTYDISVMYTYKLSEMRNEL